MDVFGKLTDILVLCIVGFVLPALLVAFLMEEVRNVTINVRVREFAEDVATKGYLDRERYESFLLELNSAGMIIEEEISVEHELLAPEYRMRTVENVEDMDDTEPGNGREMPSVPEFTGNVLWYKDIMSYGEIIEELYDGNGICYFSRGDRFEIKLWKNADNMNAAALGRIFHVDMPKELVAMYGVRIRDEETEKT